MDDVTAESINRAIRILEEDNKELERDLESANEYIHALEARLRAVRDAANGKST